MRINFASDRKGASVEGAGPALGAGALVSTLLRATRDPAVHLDARGTLVAHNAAAVDVLGVPEDVLLTWTASDSPLAWRDAAGQPLGVGNDPIAQSLAQMRDVGPVVVMVETGAAGRRVWLQVRTAVLAEGGIIATLAEVTAQHDQRRALTDIWERQREVIDTLAEGVVVQDATGTFMVVNRAFCELTGLDEGALVGRTLDTVPLRLFGVDGRPLPGADGLHSDVLCTGRTVRRLVVRLQRPDGQERWAQLSCTPLQDGPDVAAGAVVSSWTDITLRREQERALGDAAALRDAIIRQHTEGIVVYDPEGRVVLANDAAARLLQVPAARLAASSLSEPPVDLRDAEGASATSWLQAAARARGGGRRRRDLTVQFRSRDGETHWLKLVIQPLVHAGADQPWGAVASLRDVTVERDVEALAYRDPLTGLANRRALDEELSRGLGRARRGGLWVGLLFIDLDDFKRINDTLGHSVGDAALIEVARRLAGVVRSGELLARLGGDEFVVLAVDVLGDLNHARAACQALRHRIHKVLHGDPLRLQGREFPITATVGVAIGPADATEGSALLEEADRRMYAIKASSDAS